MTSKVTTVSVSLQSQGSVVQIFTELSTLNSRALTVMGVSLVKCLKSLPNVALLSQPSSLVKPQDTLSACVGLNKLTISRAMEVGIPI